MKARDTSEEISNGNQESTIHHTNQRPRKEVNSFPNEQRLTLAVPPAFNTCSTCWLPLGASSKTCASFTPVCSTWSGLRGLDTQRIVGWKSIHLARDVVPETCIR